MKKINIQFFLILLFLWGAVQFPSCVSKKVDPPLPDTINVPKGVLSLHLHYVIDEEEVYGYDIAYKTTAERRISLSKAEMYLSKFQLVRKDGSVYSVPDSIIFKYQEKETYVVANVPAENNYQYIRFYVGLDPAANSKNPTSAPNDILNKPSMWFGASAQPDGYVFFNAKGEIDTSSVPADGNKLISFSYKIGTNANYRQVALPVKEFGIAPNKETMVHLYIDMSRLFTGIQLGDNTNFSVNTTAENSGSLAAKISNNIATMFRYE